MLRYAILIHDYPYLHWDLLVEHSPDEKLKTWRLAESPREDVPISAEALPDHRRLYLDYEGPLSGDRGEVKRWDAGAVVIVSQTATAIVLEMRGERIQGKAELEHLKDNFWQFRYTPSQVEPVTPSNA